MLHGGMSIAPSLYKEALLLQSVGCESNSAVQVSDGVGAGVAAAAVAACHS